MAQIHLPLISPFSVSSPLHEAEGDHIQSHHLAYEIAGLSRKLQALMAHYEAELAQIDGLRAQYQAKPRVALAKKISQTEKRLLASMLPYQIKQLRTRLKSLNQDLLLMTRR